jgi:alpha-L-arabinofuranosidase
MRNRDLLPLFFLFQFATTATATAVAFESCPAQSFVKPANSYAVYVDVPRAIKRIGGEFFGFNLEWVEFQLSLWDESKSKVDSGLLELLKPFVGAVYRYPGGSGSNFFDWTEAVSPRSGRMSKRRYGWSPPIPVSFGPEEYLNFVANVSGRAWYVANLYGREAGQLTTDQLATEAEDLARRMLTHRASGLPAVERWELGNELDRLTMKWSPDKLAKVAGQVAGAIQAADKNATFLILQQEYPAMQAEGFTQKRYNETLARLSRDFVSEYVAHIYYDGGRSEMPLPAKLRSMCSAMDDIKRIRSDQREVPFWITETARVPEGMWEKDSRKVWTDTANLQAAISVADLFISSAKISSIKGAFVHALHASKGPWPMFHKSNDGILNESTVFQAMRLLRESMLPVVLSTSVESKNIGGYGGGYDVNAVVMTDPDKKKISIWAVNRSGVAASVPFVFNGLSVGKKRAVISVLTAESLLANNYVEKNRIKPTASEVLNVRESRLGPHFELAPYSVTTIQFNVSDILDSTQ